jgi:insulysin
MASTLKIIDHDAFYVSPNDKTRKYRHITIEENQIQCLLISDSTTDKSAACCDVHVGSMADPLVAQGLAHFLEVSLHFNSLECLS